MFGRWLFVEPTFALSTLKRAVIGGPLTNVLIQEVDGSAMRLDGRGRLQM